MSSTLIIQNWEISGFYREDLIVAFKIFTGPLDVDPSLIFLLPLEVAYEGNPTGYSKVRAIAVGEDRSFR